MCNGAAWNRLNQNTTSCNIPQHYFQTFVRWETDWLPYSVHYKRHDRIKINCIVSGLTIARNESCRCGLYRSIELLFTPSFTFHNIECFALYGKKYHWYEKKMIIVLCCNSLIIRSHSFTSNSYTNAHSFSNFIHWELASFSITNFSVIST